LKRCSAENAAGVSFQKPHRFDSGHDAVQQRFRINANSERGEHQHAGADFLRNRDWVELFPI
jgi:hypothetical protein